MGETYQYETGKIWDDLYDVTLNLERIKGLLRAGAHLTRNEREILINALNIVAKLEKKTNQEQW